VASGLEIRMRATGTVSGHALDVNGDPLALAHVEAMEIHHEYDIRVLTPVASTDTDDRGEFRLSGLDASDYYIRILPPPVGIESYPSTFYPSAISPADASKVTAVPGSEVAGIDVRLPSRGIKVSGKLVIAGNETPRATVSLIPRTSSLNVPPTFDMHRMSNEFEIDGVPPGSYYLYAVTDFNIAEALPGLGYRASPQWVRVPLEVANKDVQDLKIPIVPTGSIKGRIVIAAGAANSHNLDLSRIPLRAVSSEATPVPPLLANASQAGEFQYNHLSEMTLFLMDSVVADDWFIAGVRLDGNDVMSSGFSATPGRVHDLEITISNAGGTLTGIVKDSNEKPVPTARLLLLPDPSLRANPSLIRTGLASEKGEFLMQTIPPGHYTVIAFPDEDELTPAYLRDLDAVEKDERFGQQIYINAGQTSRIDLSTVSRD
jgi:hypothetical protein